MATNATPKWLEVIKMILEYSIPSIKNLIQSKVVPILKRKSYEIADEKIDKLISDLAQNASKIKDETNEKKKAALVEGTKLGCEMLEAISTKLKLAAEEIRKAL